MTAYKGPADSSSPCDECGGPTYTFDTGSIWCPNEDAHPGGRFVKRVAFERPPAREARTSTWERTALPKRPVRQPQPVVASKPAPIRESDGFDRGLDGFVKS